MEPQQPVPQTPFENQFTQRMYGSAASERTYTDKLLSRKEVSQIQELVKKDDLNRSELLELLYLLSSAEAKLANFNDWDRYLNGKFLTWIRDLVSVAEILYDYKTEYDERSDDDEVKQLMETNRKLMLHNIKFLCDIFLYMLRSSLSLNMSAFDILATNKYEYAYNEYPGIAPREQPAKSPFKISMGR
jgi:hypothetical protein